MCWIKYIYATFVATFCGCFGDEQLYANRLVALDDHYHANNSILNVTARSLIDCHAICLPNLQCLSFFYNKNSGRCILHKESFTYTTPSVQENGWSFFLTKQGRRCPDSNGFMHYRQLDLCYNFNAPVTINYTAIKAHCSSFHAELIRVDSEDKQKYVEFITANNPTIRICIQGTDMIDHANRWTFDDGTLMTYFNWDVDAGEPNGGKGYLEMFTGHKWHDLAATSSNPCLPICERR